MWRSPKTVGPLKPTKGSPDPTVAVPQVDYTIAVAERSLARSVKRCMGKENLMKAPLGVSFF